MSYQLLVQVSERALCRQRTAVRKLAQRITAPTVGRSGMSRPCGYRSHKAASLLQRNVAPKVAQCRNTSTTQQRRAGDLLRSYLFPRNGMSLPFTSPDRDRARSSSRCKAQLVDNGCQRTPSKADTGAAALTRPGTEKWNVSAFEIAVMSCCFVSRALAVSKDSESLPFGAPVV